jgi:hypothetical protein
MATAIPPAATLNVAIHVLHVLPDAARDDLAQDLLANAAKNAARALHLCHHGLELDGKLHDYEAEAWLATVYDIASFVLESARRDQDPPTVVRQAQEAISWLSAAMLELDRDSPETAAALAEALGRLLIVWVFTVGSPGASQPPAPTDLGMTVSRHPALLTNLQNARTHRQWANRPGSRSSSPSHHRLNRL